MLARSISNSSNLLLTPRWVMWLLFVSMPGNVAERWRLNTMVMFLPAITSSSMNTELVICNSRATLRLLTAKTRCHLDMPRKRSLPIDADGARLEIIAMVVVRRISLFDSKMKSLSTTIYARAIWIFLSTFNRI